MSTNTTHIELTEGNNSVTIHDRVLDIRVQFNDDDYDVYIMDVDATAGEYDPFGDAYEIEIPAMRGELDPDREYDPETVAVSRDKLDDAADTWLDWYNEAVEVEAQQAREREEAEVRQRATVNEVITSHEAAVILGIKQDSVRVACGRGQYKTARKVGGTWLVHRAEVEARRDQA